MEAASPVFTAELGSHAAFQSDSREFKQSKQFGSDPEVHAREQVSARALRTARVQIRHSWDTLRIPG